MAGKRPIGVFLIIILYAVTALSNLASAALQYLYYLRGTVTQIAWDVLLISSLLGCAAIVAIVGLLKLKEWSRKLAIVMSFITIMMLIIVVFISQTKGQGVPSVFPIILHLTVIGYLISPKIRGQFE